MVRNPSSLAHRETPKPLPKEPPRLAHRETPKPLPKEPPRQAPRATLKLSRKELPNAPNRPQIVVRNPKQSDKDNSFQQSSNGNPRNAWKESDQQSRKQGMAETWKGHLRKACAKLHMGGTPESLAPDMLRKIIVDDKHKVTNLGALPFLSVSMCSCGSYGLSYGISDLYAFNYMHASFEREIRGKLQCSLVFDRLFNNLNHVKFGTLMPFYTI